MYLLLYHILLVTYNLPISRSLKCVVMYFSKAEPVNCCDAEPNRTKNSSDPACVKKTGKLHAIQSTRRNFLSEGDEITRISIKCSMPLLRFCATIFAKCNCNLSKLSNPSRSKPTIFCASLTPMNNTPPAVLRNAQSVFNTACSIFLSLNPVRILYRNVSLNSTPSLSPSSMIYNESFFTLCK